LTSLGGLLKKTKTNPLKTRKGSSLRRRTRKGPALKVTVSLTATAKVKVKRRLAPKRTPRVRMRRTKTRKPL